MSETPDNKVMDEAPAQGASSSEPEASTPKVQVTRGGKARPSVAGAKAVRPTVSPAAIPQVDLQAQTPDQQGQPTEQADVDSPDKADFSSVKRPSVAGKRDSADDVRDRAKKKKKRNLGPAFVVIIVILCVAAIAAGSVAALRWALPNDVADIQGTWVTQEGAAPISITDSSIVLSDDVSYGYSLDTVEKTIGTTFFNMEGKAHYRFSRDRQSVAIIEGTNFTWQETLKQDLPWMWEDFKAMLEEAPYDPLGAEQGITLHRVVE